MAEVTYYVALSFVATEEGIAAGEPTECFNPVAVVSNRYEDHGARSSGLDRVDPGVWCDHPGRGAPGARQWAGRSVR